MIRVRWSKDAMETARRAALPRFRSIYEGRVPEIRETQNTRYFTEVTATYVDQRPLTSKDSLDQTIMAQPRVVDHLPLRDTRQLRAPGDNLRQRSVLLISLLLTIWTPHRGAVNLLCISRLACHGIYGGQGRYRGANSSTWKDRRARYRRPNDGLPLR